jgi:hypothetical protein
VRPIQALRRHQPLPLIQELAHGSGVSNDVHDDEPRTRRTSCGINDGMLVAVVESDVDDVLALELDGVAVTKSWEADGVVVDRALQMATTHFGHRWAGSAARPRRKVPPPTHRELLAGIPGGLRPRRTVAATPGPSPWKFPRASGGASKIMRVSSPYQFR